MFWKILLTCKKFLFSKLIDISDLEAEEKFILKIANVEGIAEINIHIPNFSIPQKNIIAGGKRIWTKVCKENIEKKE